MPVEVFKKRMFVTSRVIRADSRESAVKKFDVVSENIDPTFEGDGFTYSWRMQSHTLIGQ